MKIKSALLASMAIFSGAILLVGTLACVSSGTVDKFNAGPVKQLVDAVNADPTANAATREAAQRVVDAAADMADSAHSMIHSAATGDWKSLLLQLGVGALGLAGTGVATTKYVNKVRDASSADRTSEDLIALQNQIAEMVSKQVNDALAAKKVS